MGNASGLSRAPLPMIFPSQASANSMSATLWLRAERLDGVAVDAVLSDSAGVGSATAAVVSTSPPLNASTVQLCHVAEGVRRLRVRPTWAVSARFKFRSAECDVSVIAQNAAYSS